jgi:hypothetical protein
MSPSITFSICSVFRNRNGEDIEIRNHGPERADADARQLDRAQLGLLDRLLLAAELHGREHLDGEPAAGRLLELLAHADHGFDRGIPQRMNVRRFQHHGVGGQGAADRRAAGDAEQRHREATPKRFTSNHHRNPPFQLLLLGNQSGRPIDPPQPRMLFDYVVR